MVQREVADRFFAQPGTKEYGAVSVLVQLAAERTGFHPVSRTVFRPQPNVDSALVAFRRTELPADYAAREGGRHGCVRPPAQDAPELARAGRARVARAGGRGAGRDRPSRRDPRRGARARGVRRAREGLADEPCARAGQGQPRARRRPAARRRQARGPDRPAADRPRRPDRARRGDRAPGRGLPGRHARRGRRSASSPAAPASSRTGACGSRSGSRSPPGSAAAAPTPRRRFGSPTRRCPSRCRPRSCTALAAQIGADVPFFLADGPQLGSGDGSELEPLDLPQDFWVVVLLPHGAAKTSTADVYAAFDARTDVGRLRRAAAGAPRRARRRRSGPRDLAALPPNDLASSPLAEEIRAAGAFRADVSGAGPALYGLFHHRRDADAARRALGRLGRTWLAAPAWYG